MMSQRQTQAEHLLQGAGEECAVQTLVRLAREAGVLAERVTEAVGNDESRDQWIFLSDGSYLSNFDPDMGAPWEANSAAPQEIVSLPPDDKGRHWGAKWTGHTWVWMRGHVSIVWLDA